MTDLDNGRVPHRTPITHSLSHALAFLWATHRAYTLLLVALTALTGLLTPLHLWIGRLLIDAVARFLPTARSRITDRAVRHTLRRLYDKLGVDRRVQAAVRAMRLGLVE